MLALSQSLFDLLLSLFVKQSLQSKIILEAGTKPLVFD